MNNVQQKHSLLIQTCILAQNRKANFKLNTKKEIRRRLKKLTKECIRRVYKRPNYNAVLGFPRGHGPGLSSEGLTHFSK